MLVFFIFIPVNLFGISMNVYNKIIGKADFTSDQLLSLISGEIFDIYPWWSEFDVLKTSFKKGINKLYNDEDVTLDNFIKINL